MKTNENVPTKKKTYQRNDRKNTRNTRIASNAHNPIEKINLETDISGAKASSKPVEEKKTAKRGRKPSETSELNIVEQSFANVRHKTKNIKIARERLKIIPLGGLEEVGKNMTVFEYGDDMILVDCGVAFPEDDMLGVDLVIPDFTYLEKNKDRLKGMVITHGHEDHIGSIPYVLKAVNTPIYATRLTLGLIQNKLEEHKLVRSTVMKCVKAGDVITLGAFTIEFIRVNHSIADSVALAITTPVGTVVHTGDFKVDYTPIDGKLIDLARFAELGKKGVLALMSDSTNSERPGYTMSESSVGKVFDGIFAGCTKRIIVATFASNIHRVQQIVNSAMKNDRKVAICGRSMENVMNIARELGYLDIPEGILIDIDEIDKYAPDRLVIVTTGSQGEEMSGLSRMASGTHRKVTITNRDLVIISATPIPGNEKLVSNVIDDLFKIGAEVVYHTLKDIHVSGHACQEEQKLILSLVKPKYFIPVHGEFRHLQAHAETAVKVGVDPDNIVLLSNGSVLELDKNFCKVTGSVPSGQILVDGLGVGDVGNIVLRDRQHLSQDGLIIVVIAMDGKTGRIMAGPDVISRGFVYVRESEDLMDAMHKEILRDMEKIQTSGIKDWSTIKNRIRDTVHDFVFSKTRRNPMVIPIISEIQ
ncbi:MAG: ribonuclease J [Clostridia bacterium]|nr:ribonuclease J [Clostridia bacterium]